MVVYVVIYNNYMGHDIYQGVYATEEKAQAFIDTRDSMVRDSFRIEEETI